MLELPDFEKSWEYENGFYQTCDITRISKFVSHLELYKQILEVPGAIVECGVFKGTSFTRFAAFREIFGSPYSKKMIGFDIFGKFPEAEFEGDKNEREKLMQEAGNEGLSTDQLMEILKRKGCDRYVELVPGDICKTVPEYVKNNPELKISLINLDTDLYEPAVVILENLYPKLQRGGLLVLDDYATFAGETKAVDDFFEGQNVRIRKFPFAKTPCYVVKE